MGRIDRTGYGIKEKKKKRKKKKKKKRKKKEERYRIFYNAYRILLDNILDEAI